MIDIKAKDKVECVDVDDYGKFYEGDSYIVLNTYKNKETEKNNPNTFSLVEVDMKWSKIYSDSVLLIATNDKVFQSLKAIMTVTKEAQRRKKEVPGEEAKYSLKLANLPSLRIIS
ncbi:hypothetical protein AC249_AIPGENE18214 [Exaiptasia diaphana]|nr:hypothetical protein AC249_AIPGENE18214 [Exaiptasia diaphana]